MSNISVLIVGLFSLNLVILYIKNINEFNGIILFIYIVVLFILSIIDLVIGIFSYLRKSKMLLLKVTILFIIGVIQIIPILLWLDNILYFLPNGIVIILSLITIILNIFEGNNKKEFLINKPIDKVYEALKPLNTFSFEKFLNVKYKSNFFKSNSVDQIKKLKDNTKYFSFSYSEPFHSRSISVFLNGNVFSKTDNKTHITISKEYSNFHVTLLSTIFIPMSIIFNILFTSSFEEFKISIFNMLLSNCILFFLVFYFVIHSYLEAMANTKTILKLVYQDISMDTL